MKRSTKTTKKLTLARETVRLISTQKLQALAGGGSSNCYQQQGGSLLTCEPVASDCFC